MCNAWNHPRDCQCGWGGLGHSGVRGGYSKTNTISWIDYVPHIISSYRSVTIPNATCPVCGADVFYYWNANGSSVFFDELGPPWPKHPCTDNSGNHEPARRLNLERDKSKYTWEEEGWIPVQIINISLLGSIGVTLKLKTLRKEKTITIIIENYKKQYNGNLADLFNGDVILFFRDKVRLVELSVLTDKNTAISFTCPPVKIETTIQVNRAKKPASNETSTGKTAIELALEAAKKKKK